MVGGSKEKQTNAEKGGEGVQNPGNFADVLYEWSLMYLLSLNRRGKTISPVTVEMEWVTPPMIHDVSVGGKTFDKLHLLLWPRARAVQNLHPETLF